MKSNEIIENYNEIWKRASNSVKQWFDTKSVYNEKYQKTEIKSTNQFQIIMEKLTQILTIMKYEKKALNVFVYQ